MTTDFNFKNVPEIRFKDFEDIWSKNKILNIADRCDNLRIPITKTNRTKGNIPYYGANGIQSYIKGYTHDGEYILVAEDGANDLKNYPIIYVNGKCWVNNHAHVIKGNSLFVKNKFLLYELKQINFEPLLVGSSRFKLNSNILMGIQIKYPSLPEQEKIGSLFFKLDTLIATSKQKTKKLKMLKRALLQKMFASEKQRFPEIRFKGFNNEWEKKKFEEIYNKVSEKNDLTFKGNKIISVANMYFKNTNNESDDKYMRTYNVFRVGDIAFEGNKSKYFKYGRFVENTIGNGIVSHVFDVLRPKSDYNLYYWKYFINNDNIMGRILRKCTTKATMMNNLTSSAFLKQTILVPSLPEQEKIGSLFFKLDALITTSEQKSAKLEELKKALLQKMFI